MCDLSDWLEISYLGLCIKSWLRLSEGEPQDLGSGGGFGKRQKQYSLPYILNRVCSDAGLLELPGNDSAYYNWVQGSTPIYAT